MEDQISVRVSGSSAGVQAACQQIGGDSADDGEAFWLAVREHSDPYFSGEIPLWRISVPAQTPPLKLQGSWLLDWGGAQRWLVTDQEPETIRRAVSDAGGHATQFRGGDRAGDVFHPLPAAMMELHRNVKSAFDPKGILNPGRMYGDW
jgi:glycolate oxidase FAD binding subunit